MDPDDSNKVTVDTVTLLGTNDMPQGFAIDHDNELVFFHDSTTKFLSSVWWDLVSNFKTYTLELPQQDWGDIAYSQGYMYYVGIDPTTKAHNSSFYRFDPGTGEIYIIEPHYGTV